MKFQEILSRNFPLFYTIFIPVRQRKRSACHVASWVISRCRNTTSSQGTSGTRESMMLQRATLLILFCFFNKHFYLFFSSYYYFAYVAHMRKGLCLSHIKKILLHIEKRWSKSAMSKTHKNEINH